MIRVTGARPRAYFVMAILLAVGAAGAVYAPPASAADVVRWVSPSGKGSKCSASSPCTLATAQAQVRAAAPNARGDLVVRLVGGTYSLAAPLTFGPSDSGTNGHVVRYEAAPGATPVLSGAQRIRGWKVKDRQKNIWQASVPPAFAARQMWVDGVRSRLASRPAVDVLGSMTRTSTGYVITNPGIAAWRNLTDAELVYPGGGYDSDPGAGQSFMPWTWSMCGVSSASSNAVVVDAACFANAAGATDAAGEPLVPFLTKPTRVQNNEALLGTPGEFYLDDAADKVYYVPRADENLASATVVMPQVSSLLEGAGTSAAPIHDLQFIGLTFEHATWRPSPTLGVVDIQANVLSAAPNYLTEANPKLSTIPAAVSFTRAKRVLLERNVVQHVGGAGIAFTGGGEANVLRGNVVTDASAGGINVGDGTGLYIPSSYEVDAVVSNNLVTDVAVEYQGGVGIFAGWVKGAHIEHNEVADLPYTGISLGWGWASYSGELVDNHVDGNYVHDVMNSTLYDGGAIYINGRHGDATTSTVVDNHIAGDPQPYGAMYLDSGVSHYRVVGNVVEDVGSGWVFLQNMDGARTSSNLVTGNWSDTTKQVSAIDGLDASNQVVDNQLGLSSWPQAARDVIEKAGLEPAYADIRVS